MTKLSEILHNITVALTTILAHTRQLRSLVDKGDIEAMTPLLDARDSLINNVQQRFASLDQERQHFLHNESRPLVEAIQRENEQLLHTLHERKAHALQQLHQVRQRQSFHAYTHEEQL